ncbi:hypothetical protein ACVWZZ_003493 [Bradyrhizobium sp. LM6.10]
MQLGEIGIVGLGEHQRVGAAAIVRTHGGEAVEHHGMIGAVRRSLHDDAALDAERLVDAQRRFPGRRWHPIGRTWTLRIFVHGTEHVKLAVDGFGRRRLDRAARIRVERQIGWHARKLPQSITAVKSHCTSAPPSMLSIGSAWRAGRECSSGNYLEPLDIDRAALRTVLQPHRHLDDVVGGAAGGLYRRLHMREHVGALRVEALGHHAGRAIAAEDDTGHHEMTDAAGVRDRIGMLEAADMDALATRVTGHDALPFMC